jgi:hypothetical protein
MPEQNWVRGAVVVAQALQVATHGVPQGGAHRPAMHWVGGVQTIGLLPTQVPFWQVSVWVQALPSSQGVSLAFCGLEQVPVAGLQVPGS